MALDVLVIDDEEDIRDLVTDIVKEEGFTARAAAESTKAFEMINQKVPSAIILDVWLQGSDLDGLGILEIVKKRYPLLPVIIISGHGTIETAVNAIKMGAYDYLEKPFTHDKLIIMLKRACEAAKLKRENYDLKSKVATKNELIGNSNIISKLKGEIEKVAPTSGRVMVEGPTGAGKELAARLIHKKSKRANGPFVVFNPTGLSHERIEAELFGEPRKFSEENESTSKLSLIESANNGSLYIDEVGNLPVSIQGKLLKFLQYGSLEKTNSDYATNLDVRIITSTSRNLQNDVNQGNFREDLFYRLNVVPIRVPPLSERKEDIPILTQYFVKQLVKFSGLPPRKFSDEAIAALQAYDWPGNIRQLRNVIEWTMIMNPSSGNDKYITADMLPNEVVSNGITIGNNDANEVDMMSMPLREAREVFERQYLAAQMSRFNNNISKTSNFVGMERSALHRKLKLLNIHSGNKGEEQPESDTNKKESVEE
jgi:two-component system nitrogen regulation response regulator NtrX